jgi:hypothetical protein
MKILVLPVRKHSSLIFFIIGEEGEKSFVAVAGISQGRMIDDGLP